jgi:hypothetical protein
MPKAVKDYVDRCARVLGLGHWEIKVSEDPSSEDAWADVEVSQNLYQATIRFSRDLWKEKPTEIRRVVAHELIHCHYAGVERLVETLQKPLGTAAYEIVEHVWDVESERAADSLSTVVAGLLPLPTFGDK